MRLDVAVQAFIRLVPNIGRSYHSQSIQLVALCRQSKRLTSGNRDQWEDLALVIDEAHIALAKAANGAASAKDAFSTAEAKLIDYSLKYALARSSSDQPEVEETLRERDITEQMKTAREKDEEGRKRSCWVKKRQGEAEREGLGGKDRGLRIDAYIGKQDLTGEQHHIDIPKQFSSHQRLDVVLWILIQKKVVELEDNAYFYKNIPKDYGQDFKFPPLKYHDELGSIDKKANHLELYVLLDRKNHIIINRLNQNQRVFGNIWKSTSDQTIVLKDVGGDLEAAERVVSSQTKRHGGAEAATTWKHLMKAPDNGEKHHIIDENTLPLASSFSPHSTPNGQAQFAAVEMNFNNSVINISKGDQYNYSAIDKSHASHTPSLPTPNALPQIGHASSINRAVHRSHDANSGSPHDVNPKPAHSGSLPTVPDTTVGDSIPAHPPRQTHSALPESPSSTLRNTDSDLTLFSDSSSHPTANGQMVLHSDQGTLCTSSRSSDLSLQTINTTGRLAHSNRPGTMTRAVPTTSDPDSTPSLPAKLSSTQAPSPQKQAASSKRSKTSRWGIFQPIVDWYIGERTER